VITRRLWFTPEAKHQADEIDAWWQANAAAPALFADELRTVAARIRRLPGMGAPYLSATLTGVQRIALSKTPFHVYYVVRAEDIIVVAVWGMARGHGPPFPSRLPSL
jgi:plasmid stabilization system protein ParE